MASSLTALENFLDKTITLSLPQNCYLLPLTGTTFFSVNRLRGKSISLFCLETESGLVMEKKYILF